MAICNAARPVAPAAGDLPPLTTDEFAAQRRVLPQSVRKRYCLTGSYFGVRPVKQPNGRLLWPRGQ